MARILFLCSRPPYPPNDGARVRMFNLAKLLSEEHEVDVLAVARDSKYEDPEGYFESYRVFEEHPLRFYARGIRSLFSGDPIQCGVYLSPTMKREVDQSIDEYDLIYCTHLATVKYVEDHDLPKVIDLVDAVSNNFSEFIEDSSLPWRFIYRIEAKRVERYELVVADQFDRCFITTQNDREQIASDNIDVVPNGVSESLFEYERRVPDSNEIVFLGDLSYIPNENAVKWFVNDIFPLVQDSIDNVTFLIVGKSPSSDIKQFDKREDVTVTGFVDNPYEYVHRTRLSVAPVRIGGGIQNKVLESMGLGTPVVTTHFGATGINASDGEELLIRNDEAAFAEAVVELLEDNALADRLSANGRRLIREEYTWNSIGDLLNDHIEDVLEESKKQATNKS